MKIDHIGIAVKNLAVAREVYSTLLNDEPYKKETVESDMVTTLFYRTGDSKIELLEPTDLESPIRKFIEKRGEGIILPWKWKIFKQLLLIIKKKDFHSSTMPPGKELTIS
jgi:catechol 2,3-dioxygenase-like lactoylglutathione lyase family enzyme